MVQCRQAPRPYYSGHAGPPLTIRQGVSNPRRLRDLGAYKSSQTTRYTRQSIYLSSVANTQHSLQGPPRQRIADMSPKSPKGGVKKFTAEEDQRLLDLKENKSMPWKQIAEFFPDRSAGTLQVRYSTKLRAKTTQWTEEAVCRRYRSLLSRLLPALL